MLSISFSIDPDVTIQKRIIYTFWDLLGDVGGLFGSLALLGSKYFWFVGIFTGSRMKQFMYGEILRLERKPSQNYVTESSLEKVKSIRKRKKPGSIWSGRILRLFCKRKEYQI